MGKITDLFRRTYRDYATDGVASSGLHEPQKSDIRDIGLAIEEVVGGIATGGRPYATKALMDADTTQPRGTIGRVYEDGNRNGFYSFASTGWVADPSVMEGVAALLTPRIDQAQATASLAKGAVVPRASAAVQSNDASATVYTVTLPAGFDPTVEAAAFAFAIPATAKSGTVRLVVNGVSRDVFMAVGQPLRQGWTATFQVNNGGGKWNLIGQAPDSIGLLGVERTAGSAMNATARISGVDVVLTPINGDPNELYVDRSGLVNDDFFWAYVLVANTEANPRITTADGRRLAVTECPIGTLRPGDRVRIVYSGGINNFIFRERKTLPTLTGLAALAQDEVDLVDKFARDFHALQWAINGSPQQFAITAAGSSVTTEISRNRDGATDYAPSHRLADRLNTGRVRGVEAVDDNWSRGGQTISQFYAQISESPYWKAGTSRAVFLAPGPNDWRVAGYHTGQTLPGGITVLESLILEAKNRGLPTLIALPFDPDVSQEDYASFYTNEGKSLPQQYPTYQAAPVNVNPATPASGMHPSANDSVGTADMTGNGLPIKFDRRFEHGASEVRALAARYSKCVVILDSRRAYHRAVEALMPGAYEKRVLYGTGDPIHPLRYAHDVGFEPPIRAFAQDVLAGRPIKRVYDGQ